jgi:cell division protease FtsH
MVQEYAMGTGLNSQRMAMATGDELSDTTRNMRDQEQRDLADEAYRRANALVRSHRDKLDELASTLLANEVLERKDIDQIMADTPPLPDRHPLPDVRLVATRDPEAEE